MVLLPARGAATSGLTADSMSSGASLSVLSNCMPDDELYAVDTIDSGADSLTSTAGREVGAGLAVITSTGATSIVAGSMIGADSITLLATSGGVTAVGASIVGTITTGASSGFVTAFGTNTAFSLGNAAALAASSAAA